MEEENSKSVTNHNIDEAIAMETNICEHHIMPTRTRQCLSRWESLVECIQAKMNQKPCEGYHESTSDDDDNYVIDSSDKDDTISTSLGLHLEVGLDIDHQEMVMDDVSMPDI